MYSKTCLKRPLKKKTKKLFSRPITVNLVLVRTVKNNYFSLCTK